jgi:hypothetical protein
LVFTSLQVLRRVPLGASLAISGGAICILLFAM